LKSSCTPSRAARHDILRRLAPPLRHDMVVHLQALTMMADLLAARLERGALAQETLQDAVSRMATLARDAVRNCADAAGWLEQAPEDTTTAKAAITECVHLLATSLSFRGFALQPHAVQEASLPLARAPLRLLLAASVFGLADSAAQPGAIVLRSEAVDGRVELQARFGAKAADTFTMPYEAGECTLRWSEVEALAAECDAVLERDASCVVLRMPCVALTTPLKMAPV
jgi:hypothetical protein